jgi:hypothetical protein
MIQGVTSTATRMFFLLVEECFSRKLPVHKDISCPLVSLSVTVYSQSLVAVVVRVGPSCPHARCIRNRNWDVIVHVRLRRGARLDSRPGLRVGRRTQSGRVTLPPTLLRQGLSRPFFLSRHPLLEKWVFKIIIIIIIIII